MISREYFRMLLKLALPLILVIGELKSVFGCDGHKVKVDSFTNCGGKDAVILVEDGFQVTLTEDCKIVPKGCFVGNKPFNSANLTLELLKDGVQIINEVIDVCAVANEAPAELLTAVKSFGLPEKCPVKMGKVCPDGTHVVDISAFKNMIPMAVGKININMDTEFDTGKSCMKLALTIE